MSSLFAVGLAPVLQPWGMIAAGVAVVVDAKLVSWESFLGLIFFGLLATSVLLAMEGLSILRPERADVVLTNVKVWIESHTDQIIIVVFAVLGLWLIGYSSYLLATS
jgi:hypothetical protein